MSNSTPELKETCGHGFPICFSTECTKPINWDERMRRRHQYVEGQIETLRGMLDNQTELKRKYDFRGEVIRGMEKVGAEMYDEILEERDSARKEVERLNKMLEYERQREFPTQGQRELSMALKLQKMAEGLMWIATQNWSFSNHGPEGVAEKINELIEDLKK